MNQRLGAVACLLAAGMLLLSACADAPGRYIGESEPAAETTGPVKSFTVHASSSGYDLTEIKVKRGNTVQITLKNKQGMHSLKIKGYNKEVRGGKTITFTADQAGTFEYSCNISCGKNHKEMKGILIVK
ncbi:cupredoxin domain-containing protein [Paenibacillus sp. oral taxon 786]|uniref:cupredoxin domain-containing protein n=1 Tax=Paenibacillus sp. oral taxon 786 TaxID=652715 RepID=UPI0002E7DF06|nr:cupredoxin domain-containing protein [Paenibacillus sp. oral taxon 786]